MALPVLKDIRFGASTIVDKVELVIGAIYLPLIILLIWRRDQALMTAVLNLYITTGAAWRIWGPSWVGEPVRRRVSNWVIFLVGTGLVVLSLSFLQQLRR